MLSAWFVGSVPVEKGDLSAHATPRMVAVLEGVLVDVETTTEKKGLFGREKVTGVNWSWLDLPLKNLVSIKRRFPDVAVDVVTFMGDDAAERASTFFNKYGIDDFNDVYAADFKEWCWSLSFRPEIVQVYDSSMERLYHYGQRGFAVVKGAAF